MELRYDTISFLSDYGHDDEFVGVVKSVVRSIAPAVAVVDITHMIAPYDVRAGSLTLARSAQYLCPGVVIAVVDPGVGGERRSIAVEVGGGISVLIGPDNGLLAPAVGLVGGASRAVELTNADFQLAAPGPTFAGRDIFAPAAAHLCMGVDLLELGNEIDPAGLLPGMLPLSHVDDDGAFAAEVLWVDRYGNAQLNVDPADVDDLGECINMRFPEGSRTARRVATFSEIGAGEVALMVDSYGLLAVVLDRRSASTELGLRAGVAVHLEAFDDQQEGVAPRGVSTSVEIGRRPDHTEDQQADRSEPVVP